MSPFGQPLFLAQEQLCHTGKFPGSTVQLSFHCLDCPAPGSNFHNQASTLNTGFRDALNLMKLGKAADEADEECSITPAPKKPRLSDEIAQGLEITPPPVVGMQSDSWFTLGEVGGKQ